MAGDDGLALAVSACLFTATTTWFLRYLRRNRFSDSHGPSVGKRSTVFLVEGATIGSRGTRALSPPIPYLQSFYRCLQDPCDPTDNPQGYIALCVAENKLVTDLIAERLMQQGTASAAFSDSSVYCYNSFLGLPVAREAVAYFLAKHFLFPDAVSLTPEQALHHISPNNVALASGAAAVLNFLFYALGEEGDATLIPAPYYAAFENDMKVVAGCVPFPVQMANPALGPTENELDMAFLQAKSQGLRVKFLLLTNPNNPLGVIYSADVISKAIKWARKRSMQTIVDEIYALSTHKKRGHGFNSVIRVLENNFGDDVHMVWALSKDFGSSGFRVGILYTQCQSLLESFANLNLFSGVSHPIQMITAEMLTDDAFVESFLDDSRRCLRQSYEICVAKLEEMVIPFIPAVAGLFVYVDFSSLLPAKSFEGEARLAALMVDHAHIVLTPGESQRERTPGMFRICYAWVSPDVLEIAMERLSKLVGKIRKMDWCDLNETTLISVLD